MTAAEVAVFPRIVRFLAEDDSPGSSCPHCGATGRFIQRFLVEDGRVLGAMRGCAKLFPSSRVAHEDLRLRKKLADREKRGWTLNRADQRALTACERFFAGEIDERSALTTINLAKRSNQMRFRR